MKKTILITCLLASSSAFAASPWALRMSFDQPYFQSATQSNVSIQQSPNSTTLVTVNNQNKLEKSPKAVNVSAAYAFWHRAHWHAGLGVNVALAHAAVSGVGSISGFTLDQYTYQVGIHEYDALASLDYIKHRWNLGGQLLLGLSQLSAYNFKEQDPSTSYASHAQSHFNYGMQLHALYNVDPHLQMGLEAGYRLDGDAKLGARTNVYKSTGSVIQKISYAYAGLVFGVQF